MSLGALFMVCDVSVNQVSSKSFTRLMMHLVKSVLATEAEVVAAGED